MQRSNSTHTVLVVLLSVSSALLFASGCGVGQFAGGLEEDPTTPDPVVEIVNPSGERGTLNNTTQPCGAVLATFEGTKAYSNGSHSGTGYSCAGLGTYGYRYQCVELTTRHFKKNWNIMLYGDAKDLMHETDPGVVVYKAGDAAHPPVPGDALIWTNGSTGHVALIVAVRSDAIDIIEQNVKGTDGTATLSYSNGHVGAHFGTWIPAGWLHAKANTAVPATPSATSCHAGSLFGYDYCSADCPCDEGQGDCDKDADCKPGLYCAQDVGAAYGAKADVDVCQKKSTTSCHNGKVFDYSYCSADCPCGEGQGDCDNSSECQAGLYCAKDQGAKYGAAADVDVCIKIPTPSSCHKGSPYGQDYCTKDCPCSAGQGDCDSDAECKPGLHCIQDVGANFNAPAWVDICG